MPGQEVEQSPWEYPTEAEVHLPQGDQVAGRCLEYQAAARDPDPYQYKRGRIHLVQTIEAGQREKVASERASCTLASEASSKERSDWKNIQMK